MEFFLLAVVLGATAYLIYRRREATKARSDSRPPPPVGEFPNPEDR